MGDDATQVRKRSPRKRSPAKRAPRKAAAFDESAVAALNPEIAAERHLAHVELEAEPLPAHAAFRPTAVGWAARRLTMLVILAGAALLPMAFAQAQDRWIALGLIYVIVGLSINILMGYAGQISLGHQAFVGVGAFTSANAVTNAHMPFLLGLILSGAVGAAAAVLLGLVALRLKGLYLALITLAYGAVAEGSIFAIGALTGGGAGTAAPRPAGFVSNRAYVYLCFIFLGLLLAVDWRLIKSKAGRAILAIRENELAAASFGINVVGYKLLAFVLSGVFAGIAGSLFAHLTELANGSDFDFTLALTFVIMVVIGGLGSRPGIFIGSMFFAIFPLALNSIADWVPVIGAGLLLLTLTLNPGGIAQQIRPITEWLAGKRFTLKHSDQSVATGGAGVRP